MTEEEKKKSLEKKVREIFKFAEKKKVSMTGTQKISQDGYIENVVLFKDLETYPDSK